ncbi:MAG: hypothetical protein EXQ95_06880 [Alphaproteobacteria bacterium]|nr:hypothetical protein [Alphaproteobacteria bacterium]
MTIRARFTLDGVIPLARTRIAHNRGSANPEQVVLLTDVAGRAVIDRDSTAAGIRVDVFAANPVVEVVTGRLNTEVRSRITGVTNNGTEVIAVVPDRRFFVIAELARTIYNGTFRLFTRFPGESPIGSVDPDPARMIRIKFPDQSPSTTSFTDPHGLPSRSPVIHLEASAVANLAGGALNIPELTGHLVSELAHALHFQALPEAVRAAIRIRYLAALGIDGVEDGTVDWDTNQADTQVSAFIEAFDEFANVFHRTPGRTLAQRQAAYFATVAPAYVAGVTNRGPDVAGAVCATIFVNYARSPAVGLNAVVDQYIGSNAATFREFERFVRRTFGMGSPQEVALSTAAGTFGV